MQDEIFSLTLMATVQRAKVYSPNPSAQSRHDFQATLRSELKKITKGYKHQVDEKTHIQNIVRLTETISDQHRAILNGKKFRIGVAQKALNLYLKYLWCLGKIPQPPHCPFDFRIIAKLSDYKGPRWTDLDCEKDYRSLVAAAKLKAQGVPLAVWELQIYNNSKIKD